MRQAILATAASLTAAALTAGAQQTPASDLFVRPDKGYCIACHQVPAGAGPATRADVGPRLEGARMRGLGREKLRALVADPMQGNPDTLMPPFGRHRILEASEIERVVEYLQALPAGGDAAPPAAAAPAEEAAASAAASVIDKGRKLWMAKFKNGRTLASCFPNAGRRVAARYPQYDTRLRRVVTLEMAINQCRKTHGEALYEPADAETMGAIVAYVRSLSDGEKMTVRVPAAASDRYEQGKRLYFTRMGQRNFACASCHVKGAGRYYGEQLLSTAAGQAARAPFIRDGAAVTLQARIRECLERMGAAPFPAGSEELNAIEYYLSYLSNGVAIKANAPRPARS
jgi:sulfur-oxidizing protein SoxA